MQDLKVTLIQARQFWEDKQANLAHFDGLLKTVDQTDLILLPEMFHTSFSMNPAALAEGMDDSIALQWLKEKAREKNSAIYTSFIAKEKDSFFNRGIFMFPSGEFEIYDKRKLFGLAGEDHVFTPGDKKVIVAYNGWKILLQICYDLRFPEISRNAVSENGTADFDLILYVANWPERRAIHWKSLLVARAIENQCYVAGLNRVGSDGKDLNYSGDSDVFTLLGDKLGNMQLNQETAETIQLNYDELQKTRTQLPFLRDI